MKNIIKYTAAACLLLGSASCLDLNPLDAMGDNMVWDNADNFQLFANQFYGYKSDFKGGWGGRTWMGTVHTDFHSDLLCTQTVDNISSAINTSSSSDGNYSGLYTNLYRVNLLLDKAKSFKDQDAIAVPKGEALFFRGFMHFELVQMFGDVLLVTEPLDLESGELYGPRTSRTTVINQCVADLQEAAELLPETPSARGALCKYAALAMLSRVALYEGTYEKFNTNGATTTSNTSHAAELLTIAAEAAKKVIDSDKYELFYSGTLGDESYRYMSILEEGVQCNPASLNCDDNNEYILMTRRRQGVDQIGNNITHAICTSRVWWATRKLSDMYLCTDGLPIDKSPLFQGRTLSTDEYANRDARMKNTLFVPGVKYFENDATNGFRVTWDDNDFNQSGLKTHSPVGGTGYHVRRWATERECNDYYESYEFPMLRYAEVLLNYAEAMYELNGKIEDSDLDISLNLVRNRINKSMPKLSNSFVSANGLAMREEIRRERTIELFTEGFRLDDLKRWNTASTEMSQDILGIRWTGTWFETNWADCGFERNADGDIIIYTGRDGWLSSNKKYYLLPIPTDQLQLNPELGQNPGW